MSNGNVITPGQFTEDMWAKLPDNIKQNLMYAAGIDSKDIDEGGFEEYSGLLMEEYGYMFPEYSTRQEDYYREIGETEREQAISAQTLWKDQQAEMKELKWGDYDPETGEGGIFTGQEYRAKKMIETLGAMDMDIEETQRDMLNRALKQDQFKLNQTLGKTGIQSGSQSDFRKQTILNAEAKIRQANITRKGMVDQMNMDLANLTADYDDKVAMDEATYDAQYDLKENALSNFKDMSSLKQERLIDAEKESYEMGLWSSIGAISQGAPTWEGYTPPEEPEPEEMTLFEAAQEASKDKNWWWFIPGAPFVEFALDKLFDTDLGQGIEGQTIGDITESIEGFLEGDED
mgnify:CR=1 FL=1